MAEGKKDDFRREDKHGVARSLPQEGRRNFKSSMAMLHSDYRHWLRAVLEDRKKSNASYSLRALARDLEISPSRLSQVLQGKQGLSDNTARAMAENLRLPESVREYFVNLVLSVDARSKTEREQAQEKLNTFLADEDYTPLAEETFHFIREWYHLAILELLSNSVSQSNAAWIAERLGVDEERIEEAVERLFSMGLLRSERDRWIPTNKQLTTTADVPSQAIRYFNSQILRLAEKALEGQEPKDRDISTLIVGVSEEQLPELKRTLVKFRRAFDAQARKERVNFSDESRKTYALNLSFFSLEKL